MIKNNPWTYKATFFRIWIDYKLQIDVDKINLVNFNQGGYVAGKGKSIKVDLNL